MSIAIVRVWFAPEETCDWQTKWGCIRQAPSKYTPTCRLPWDIENRAPGYSFDLFYWQHFTRSALWRACPKRVALSNCSAILVYLDNPHFHVPISCRALLYYILLVIWQLFCLTPSFLHCLYKLCYDDITWSLLIITYHFIIDMFFFFLLFTFMSICCLFYNRGSHHKIWKTISLQFYVTPRNKIRKT